MRGNEMRVGEREMGSGDRRGGDEGGYWEGWEDAADVNEMGDGERWKVEPYKEGLRVRTSKVPLSYETPRPAQKAWCRHPACSWELIKSPLGPHVVSLCSPPLPHRR